MEDYVSLTSAEGTDTSLIRRPTSRVVDSVGQSVESSVKFAARSWVKLTAGLPRERADRNAHTGLQAIMLRLQLGRCDARISKERIEDLGPSAMPDSVTLNAQDSLPISKRTNVTVGSPEN